METFGFQRFLRKEGDSNPRFPLGEYTLSRRASSATRAPFLLSASTLTGFGVQKYRFSGK